MRGLASSESALMATAFLKLFMAFPPTLAALAALAVRLGLAWLEDTEILFWRKSNLNLSDWYYRSQQSALWKGTMCIRDLDNLNLICIWWFDFRLEPIFAPAPAACLKKILRASEVVKSDPKIIILVLLPGSILKPWYTHSRIAAKHWKCFWHWKLVLLFLVKMVL